MLFATLIVFLFSACTESDIPQPTPQPDNTDNELSIPTASDNNIAFPDTLILQYDEIYHTNTRNVLIELESIEDSRCPADVQCVWEGYAVIKLFVQIGIESHVIELCTLNNPDGTTLQKNQTIGDYQFNLLAVNPTPETEGQAIAREKMRVTLFVKEK